MASALGRSLQVPARVLRGRVTDDDDSALLTAAVLVAVRVARGMVNTNLRMVWRWTLYGYDCTHTCTLTLRE